MQMQLRPRCTTCRQTGHTTCTPVVRVPKPVIKRRRQVQTQARAQRCCSFCGTAGHYKPKCEKYKIFVDEAKPSESDAIMITVLDAFLKDMQNMFCRFVASQFNPSVIFNASNDAFRIFVRIFLDSFDQHMAEPLSQPPAQQHNSKIRLELCKNTSRAKKECGICLNDDIPCSKIVKLGCSHEFCGDCAEKFINTKPCCAFCRADVKEVSVASKTMLAKLKKNKKFSV